MYTGSPQTVDVESRGSSLLVGSQPLFTPKELLIWLGPGKLSRSKLYEMLKSGDIRSVRAGRKVLIPASAIREWLGER